MKLLATVGGGLSFGAALYISRNRPLICRAILSTYVSARRFFKQVSHSLRALSRLLPGSDAKPSNRSKSLNRKFLTSGLAHGHHFEQMSVRILEVEAAPAAPAVNLPVGVSVGLAAVGEFFSPA
jgi:hypothetical protein